VGLTDYGLSVWAVERPFEFTSTIEVVKGRLKGAEIALEHGNASTHDRQAVDVSMDRRQLSPDRVMPTDLLFSPASCTSAFAAHFHRAIVVAFSPKSAQCILPQNKHKRLVLIVNRPRLEPLQERLTEQQASL
jgi:hypothetical protein